MDAEPKVEIMPCPFPECGGGCRLDVVQGWAARQGIYCDRCSYRLLCDVAPGGGYARLTTASEAIAAHNALCRKVAMHGELVAFVRDLAVEDQERDGEWLGADVADRVNALLARAALSPEAKP